MNNPVNKDLLIAVVTQRQAELDKLVKLQSSQLENYRVHVEGFKALVTSYEKQLASLEAMVASQKGTVDIQIQNESNLKSMLDTLNELNKNLLSKIELQKRENELLLEQIRELKANANQLNNFE